MQTLALAQRNEVLLITPTYVFVWDKHPDLIASMLVSLYWPANTISTALAMGILQFQQCKLLHCSCLRGVFQSAQV